MLAPANSVISAREDKQTKLWQVRSGQVLLHTASPSGRDIGISVIKQGGIFGMTSLFKDMTAIVTAVTLTDCELVAIDQKIAQQALKANPNISIALLKICINALAERVRQIESLAASKLPTRLARWIFEQFREQNIEITPGATLNIEASQRLIAIIAGASRETVNRLFGKWEEAGVIEWNGRALKILDPQRLEHNANFVP